MATSQNGYPAITSSTGCKKWMLDLRGESRHLVIAPGAPGFLLAHFALWFHDTIEPLNQGQWDEWGWAYRDIRGATSLSNHASGTAIDLNAVKHPLGAQWTFKGAWRYAKIRAKLRTTYRGCIRWGGDYSGRVDEMHFEINKPRAKVEKVAARLRKTKRGRRIREASNG